jgi:acylphosphatase
MASPESEAARPRITGPVTALSALVRGHVQRVGFRYACLMEARALGLSGWVRNTPQGDVEVWAEGPGEKLEALARWLRRGPPHARVDALTLDPCPPTGAYGDFGVRA